MFDFFFETSALQNYFSEIFGITVGVFIVNELIKRRERRRLQPLRDMSYSLLFDEVTVILQRLVEMHNYEFMLQTIKFGNYKTITTLNLRGKDRYTLLTDIRKRRELSEETLQIAHDANETETYNRMVEFYNEEAAACINFEMVLKDFTLHQGAFVETSVLEQVNTIRTIIKKHFKTFKQSITQPSEIERVYLSILVPLIVENCLDLHEVLYNKRSAV